MAENKIRPDYHKDMRERYRKAKNTDLERLIKYCQRNILALTYDDVSLRTQFSDASPDGGDTSSFYSTHVPLQRPFVLAAMSDVSERGSAIATGLEGGIAVIHCNLTAKEQAAQVSAVKHYAHAFINSPITFLPYNTVGDVYLKKKEKGWSFEEFPIVDTNGILVGFITNKHLNVFEPKKNIRLEDIMFRPNSERFVTTNSQTSFKKAYEIMCKHVITSLPVVGKGRKLIGMYSSKDVKRVLFKDEGANEIWPHPNVDANGQLYAAAAIGVIHSLGMEERIELLIEAGVDVLLLAKANVCTGQGLETIDYVKRNYPNVDLVVGNIDNPKQAKILRKKNVNGYVVGVGPGSICKTRVVAGVGTPNFTAIAECVMAIEYDEPLSGDGGIKNSGDIVKVLAVGAQSITAGSIFALAKETPGEIIYYMGKAYKQYKGMGSREEQEKNQESKDKYDLGNMKIIVEQGESALVPYHGESLRTLIPTYDGGLRSGMSFQGASTLPELHANAEVVRVTEMGKRESGIHDVTVVDPKSKSIGIQDEP